MRTHIVLPDAMVAAVDELVGKRRRGAFITDAVRERLRREQRPNSNRSEDFNAMKEGAK